MSNSLITIGYVMEEKGNGMSALVADAKELQKLFAATATEAKKMSDGWIYYAAISTAVSGLQDALAGLQKGLADLQGAYAVQVEAETKLAVNMRNSMGAREEDIQSIKELCSAQQELGVIGDEVQLAGAQELAVHLKQKESLEALIPAMNDMIAKQSGLNATQESAASVAAMLGKAMDGQTGALQRNGFKLTEAQEQILKYGSESQRAATLVEIVSAKVGGMNAELAKTDVGRQKQLENALGDLKEKVGAIAQKLLPLVTYASQATVAAGGLVKAWGGLKAMGNGIVAIGSGFKSLTVEIRKSGLAARIFGVSLKTALVTSGIGLAIIALGYAVAYLTGMFDKATKATGELSEAEERARRKAEELKEARNAEESALNNARASIELYVNRLKTFNGTKEEERKLVQELNGKYGETMGYFSSVADWYQALTANSKAYCRQMVLEAKARNLANQIASTELERDELLKTLDSLGPDPKLVNHPSPTDSTPAPKPLSLDNVASSKNVFELPGLDKANKGLSKADETIESINAGMRNITKSSLAITDATLKAKNEELSAVTEEMANLSMPVKGASVAPTFGGGGASKSQTQTAVWTEEAETIAQVQENLRYLEQERAKASGATLEQLNRQRDEQQKLLRQLEELGVKTDAAFIDAPQTIADYTANIALLNKQIETASGETLTQLNRKLKEQQEGLNRLRNQGIEEEVKTPEPPEPAKTLNPLAVKLKEIQDNIALLNEQLLEADAAEAAAINRQIALWEKKADAIRNAGQASVTAMDAIKTSWGGAKGVGSGIDSISDALEKNGTLWEKLQGIVDGFFQIFEGVQAIVTLINTMTEASRQHQAAKITEAAATGVSAAVTSADAVATGIDTKMTEANTRAAEENAAAKAGEALANATASGAKVPFPGNLIAIAAGVAAVVSVLAAVGCFAGGGIVGGSSPSGDRLMARVNSGEMILNLTQQARLFKMLDGRMALPMPDVESRAPMVNINASTAAMQSMSAEAATERTVRFRIDGRTLVGVMEKEMNLNLRR